MHITRIVADEQLPLIGGLDLECDERVNLFIGPNASGKSTILRAIRGLHTWMWDVTDEGQDYYSDGDNTYTYIIELEDGEYRDLKIIYNCAHVTSGPMPDILDTVPFLYIPATRLNLPDQSIYDYRVNILKEKNVETDDPLKYLFDTDSGIFYGQFVELALQRLRIEMARGYLMRKQGEFRRALRVGYSCAKRICPEVIYDDIPHPYIGYIGSRRGYGEDVRYGMGIGTSDNIVGEPLYAGALSSGTQGTLLWVWALALKIAYHYDWEAGWEEKPAILLIDEIENHLHPTWQRRVIPALLDHFPRLQIFATTHSPFVVAGLKAGQVHLLERDENGHITATTRTENVIGWTADEILRTIMGVDDPTDDQTAAAARELRQLRKEGPRSTPEEEEQRQQQIRELRQYVDRDLLAGGPMAAQRELFEQQFAAALEKYRQSKELNQENG